MKRILCIWLALVLCLGLLPGSAFAADDGEIEFQITDGVLTGYKGHTRNLVIPEGVTTIGDYIFYSKRPQTVTLPNSLTTLADYSMAFCYDLTEITIPDGVTYIGSNAFAKCSALTTVNLGKGVKEIGENAFPIDGSLKTINYAGTAEEWSKIKFAFTNSGLAGVTIHAADRDVKMVNVWFSDEVYLGSSHRTLATKTVVCGAPYGELLAARDTQQKRFLGWFTESKGGTQVTPETIVTQTSSHYLYPQTTSRSIRLYFDSNGGKVLSEKDIGIWNVTYGQPYGELPVPENSERIFDGWYTEREGGKRITSDTIVDLEKSTTLYAHWRIGVTVTVKFDAILGLPSFSSKTVVHGQPYGELPTVTRNGHIFKGWQVKDSSGKYVLVDENTLVDTSRDHSLSATWVDATGQIFTLYFDAGGGSVTPASRKVRSGDSYRGLPTPTRPGYAFLGWYTEPERGVPAGMRYMRVNEGMLMDMSADETLYAHWQPIGGTVPADPTPTPDPTPDPTPNPTPNPGDTAFQDVQRGAWYYDAVEYVHEKGLMNGTGAAVFAPESATNRGQIVTILYRLEGSPAAGASGFSDVSASDYCAPAVAWAAENNIVNGTSADRFSPEAKITRQDFATILYRYAQYKGLDVSAAADISGYTDASKLGSYARPGVQWAIAKGLMNGVSETRLDPTGSSTRAQAATLLMRFDQQLK